MSIPAVLDRESIITASLALPAAPQIMARLYRLLLDRDAGIWAITDLLKRDPILTAHVIRMANSPAYGGEAVGSIEEALTRVGFGEVYRLVGVASASSLGRGGFRCYGFAAEAFRRRSLYGALVAERVARTAGLDARAAYTGGLLRRIGQILLDAIGAARLAPSQSFSTSGAARAVDWELRAFGVTHHEVAAILLAAWDFPAEIVAAVGQGEERRGDMEPLAFVMALTDRIVRLAGLGLTADESAFPEELPAAFGLDQDVVQRIKNETLEALEGLEQARRVA